MRKALTRMACVYGLLAFMFVPVRASSAPAIVAKDQACGVIDGDGGMAMGQDSISVTTSSGVVTVLCKVKKVPNNQGRSVYWGFDNTGFACWTSLGETENWKEHVSASGNATLACYFKKDK